MKYIKIIIVIFPVLFINSCNGRRTVEMKSPCAGYGKENPCGPKIPVNDWWLNDHKQKS